MKCEAIIEEASHFGVDLMDDDFGRNTIKLLSKGEFHWTEALTHWPCHVPAIVLENWSELDLSHRSVAFLSAMSSCISNQSVYDNFVDKQNDGV